MAAKSKTTGPATKKISNAAIKAKLTPPPARQPRWESQVTNEQIRDVVLGDIRDILDQLCFKIQQCDALGVQIEFNLGRQPDLSYKPTVTAKIVIT